MWHQDEVADIARKTFFGKPVLIEHLHGSLRGNLHVPPNFQDSGDGYPAVLMLHGLGGNRHEHGGLFIKTAASIARRGIVVLRVDFRGAGETGGSTREITLDSQIQDAIDAFEHLCSYKFVDPKRVAVLGFSFGGLTAACLAGKREDVAALALWAPVHDMKTTMKRMFGPLSLKAVRSRGYMQAGMMQLGADFFDDLDKISIDSMVKDYSKPLLIVQGVADTVVPVDTAFQWKRSFVSAQPEMELVQEADHAFTNDTHAWNVIDRTCTWLEQVLHGISY